MCLKIRDNKIIFQITQSRTCVIMTNDFPGFDVHNIQTVHESANPQTVAGYQQAMNIVIRNTGIGAHGLVGGEYILV